jgi:hypothetical protein
LIGMAHQFHLRFMCRVTGKHVDCPAADDFASVRARWNDAVEFACPHCRARHRFTFREGYIAGSMAVGATGTAVVATR